MLSKRIIFFILSLVSSLSLPASNIELSQISSLQGLSNSSVNCILQDSSQVMWFGTWDGLNSFNGRNYKVYKYEPDNPNSITNNIIRNIVEQNGQKLWIATDKGVSRINTKTNQIDRFYLGYENTAPNKANSFKIARGNNNTMFCAVEWTLYYFNENKNEFIALNVPTRKFDVIEMYGDATGNLWILNERGEILCIRTQVLSDKTVSIKSCTKLFESTKFDALFKKSGNDFWLIDSNENLYKLNTSNNLHRKTANLGNNVDKGKVTGISADSTNIIIAYSLAGLFKFSMESNALTPVAEIDKQGILSLFWSDQKILWIGTDGNGLILMSEQNVKFNTILNRDIDKFRRSPIRAFCEDTQHNIWIGSKGNGLCLASDMHQTKPHIKQFAGLDNNAVYCIINGPNNDLFIGTDGTGINVCTPNKVEKMDLSILTANGEGFSSVYSMYMDRKQEILWIGTCGYGLVKLHLQYRSGIYKAIDYKVYSYNRSKKNSLSNNTVYSIVPENDNQLWIATRGGGLNLFDIRNEIFHPYQQETTDSISDNDVLCITKSADGTIWAGTSYGLNKIIYKNNGTAEIKHYTEHSGLPNNTIHGIIEDSNNILWLSTNKGIAKFNPANEQTINFNNGYELQNNEFSDGAYLKSSNGEIYFGGINGFNYFTPSKINERTFNPPIIFSDFTVRNQNIADRITKDKNQSIIKLNYNENFFSVSFVALDYINNSNCEYAYILEGFNKEWTTIINNNTAVFTNVPAGNYVFRVRSTNGDKLWSNNEKTFRILIRPPFWKTWWAYLAYTVIIAGLLYLARGYSLSRANLENKALIERIKREKDAEINNLKIKFFINISHEIRTPLSLIIAPLEKLVHSGESSPTVNKHLQIMYSNAQRLLNLINQLLDFRKIETGNVHLNVAPYDVVGFIHEIKKAFEEIALHKNIEFSVESNVKSLRIWFDPDSFEKILFNLLGNAFKFTASNGKIKISINYLSSKEQCEIVVSDSGIGVPPDKLEKLFDRFYQVDTKSFLKQENVGSGIGLSIVKNLVELHKGEISVESVVSEFTRFRMIFKTEKKHLEGNNYITISNEPLPFSLNSLTSIWELKENESNELHEDQLNSHRKKDTKILIVEDNSEIRYYLKQSLLTDYEIIEADNGESGRELALQFIPDLVITDVMMPKMDGIELCKVLKNDILTQHIPIIILSAKSGIEDTLKGLETGADDYVPKPFNEQILIAKVKSLLANRQKLIDKHQLTQLEKLNNEQIDILSFDDTFVNKVIDFIKANLNGEELTNEKIELHFKTSKMQLYRKLKAVTGWSVNTLIRKIRTQEAIRLLKTSDMNISEITYAIGLSDPLYFSKYFKKEFGISPQQYRKENQ